MESILHVYTLHEYGAIDADVSKIHKMVGGHGSQLGAELNDREIVHISRPGLLSR